MFLKNYKRLEQPTAHRNLESTREIDGARNDIGKRTSDFKTIASDGK